MEHEIITSRHNPLCTHFRKLASSRAYREETGEFLCDSPKLLREAELWDQPISAILYTEGAEICPSALCQEFAPRMVQVTGSVMESISPMKTPQGVVFSCRWSPREICPQGGLGPGHYLVLDGVQDPGNLGTVWRTADAFGASGLLLTGSCADPFGPKAVRATMGASFRLPVWKGERQAVAALLERSGIPLYATALREDTEDIGKVDLSQAAVVIGSEGRGISEELLGLCKKTLKIPMEDRCESLNAAVAAAIVLWEGWQK